MLLHEHHDSVEDKEDCMRPRPVADHSPSNNASDEGGLPPLFRPFSHDILRPSVSEGVTSYVLQNPTRAVPVDKPTQGEYLYQPGDPSEAAHDSIREQKNQY
jgi:hypothetical protein